LHNSNHKGEVKFQRLLPHYHKRQYISLNTHSSGLPLVELGGASLIGGSAQGRNSPENTTMQSSPSLSADVVAGIIINNQNA